MKIEKLMYEAFKRRHPIAERGVLVSADEVMRTERYSTGLTVANKFNLVLTVETEFTIATNARKPSNVSDYYKRKRADAVRYMMSVLYADVLESIEDALHSLNNHEYDTARNVLLNVLDNIRMGNRGQQ